MSFLIASPKSQAAQQTAVSGLQLQSSAYGKAVALVYGTTIIAPNLIWYGDFVATAQQSSSGGGGKGGVGGGGGGKGGGGSSGYTYQTAVALGLCEGPINVIGNIYVNKNITTASALGFSTFLGNYEQTPWGYLTSNHPGEALGYSGIAYLAANAYQLGTSPQLPNHNVEVYGIFAGSLPSVPDANPSIVVIDLLINPHYGAGLPSLRLGDFSVYESYTMASGLWISPAYTEQTQTSSIMDDLATATNSEFVWSSGVLSLVPYGDEAISANGFTYTPPASPLYDLTDDDFLPNTNVTGSSATTNQDPVLLTRQRPSDALNSIKIECLDRSNSYNPAIIEAKDQALIQQFGLRQSSSTQMHMFADMNAGRLSAQLQLQRQAIRNIYQFTLDQRYVLLDPMDIVTLTDSALGLAQQWVRITEITENDDGTLSISAEEYLAGTGSAPLYSYETGRGFIANYNQEAGNANAPVLFEPTALLAESLEVWMALSGGPRWGGAEVYISNDGSSYKYAGRVTGSSRMGVLTAPLNTITPSATGQTIDNTDVLMVDLSESDGQLLSGTLADATSLTTLCYVDGEYIAYQTAMLTAGNAYSLTTLVRGAYGTSISAHAAGTQFARLDGSLFVFPFTQDYIGSTIYIKFVSFNIYGGGLQTLADVQPYAYTLQGIALASPLPDVTNLRSSYVASLTQLTWDEVQDFRPVQYEVRKGASWTGAQVLGRVAHPPYGAQGDGTYWVAAYSQPAAGLQVYSETPVSVSIQGSQITSNVIAAYDEEATGWLGTLGGTAVVVGSEVIAGALGNILIITDYQGTSDILHFGGEGDGTYEIPSAHVISIGRVAPCNVLVSWSSVGQHVNDNILVVSNYLSFSDVLDYSAAANTDIYPEIALSQDGTIWGAWQKYTPGAYNACAFKARMQLITLDPTVEAILEGFVFSVDVPDRDDHYVNLSVPSGGLSLSFVPDGGSTPVAFNAGPSGATIPAIQVTILNAAAGDMISLTSVTLSGCNLQILNAGSGVARNVNLLVQGF